MSNHRASMPRHIETAGLYTLAVIPLALAAYAYVSITRCFFFEDDFVFLYRLVNLDLPEYLFTPHAGHILIARNAVFRLFYELFGVRVDLYFCCVLATHVFNAFLLFRILRNMTGDALIASLGASAWGTSPLHTETLGWYAVYGQVVATTALLLILSDATRVTGKPLSAARRICWVLLALVAATSFGVGAATAIVLPLCLKLLLPEERGRSWPLLSLLVVLPLIYLGCYVLYGNNEPIILDNLRTASLQGGFSARLEEVWRSCILFLNLSAVGIGQVVLGFIGRSDSVPGVQNYAIAAVLLIAALVVRGPDARAHYRRLLACALLVGAAYGAISIGRAWLLKWLPLDWFVSRSRYHYLASIPIVIVVCLVLSNVRLARRGRMLRSALVACCLFLVGFRAIAFPPNVDHHDKAREATEGLLNRVQRAAQERPAGQPVILNSRRFGGVLLPWAVTSFPGEAAVFSIFHKDPVVLGHRVYFRLAAGQQLPPSTRRGTRIGALILPSQATRPDKTSRAAEQGS